MEKKILVIALALVLIIGVPVVIGALNQQKIIRIVGIANYPHDLPPTQNSTPTPAPSEPPAMMEEVKFSMFFYNGTEVPATFTPQTGITVYGPNTRTPRPPLELQVRNDGNVPILINVSATNIVLPSDLSLTVNAGDGDMQPLTIGVGQTRTLYIMMGINTKDFNYSPNAVFEYSFDLIVTATKK
jgi:hypothetical protein